MQTADRAPEPLGRPVKTQMAGPTRTSDSVGLELGDRGPIVCMSNKLSGGADATGPGTPLQEPLE